MEPTITKYNIDHQPGIVCGKEEASPFAKPTAAVMDPHKNIWSPEVITGLKLIGYFFICILPMDPLITPPIKKINPT